MSDHDKDLMNLVLSNKGRYSIVVDNDAVWVQDNDKDSEDEKYWVGFDEYGYHLIQSIFNVDSDYV